MAAGLLLSLAQVFIPSINTALGGLVIYSFYTQALI